MVQPAGTKTAYQIITETKRAFGDESGVQITDTDIIGWINKALIEIINKVKALQSTVSMSGIVGTAEYTLPANCINLDGVKYGAYALTHVGMEEALQTLGLRTDTTSGRPEYYWVYANQLTVYPKPSTVENLFVRYRRYATPVNTGSDVIDLPDRYYPRIAEYVLSEAYKLDENQEAYTSLRQTFEDKLSENNGQQEEISGSWAVISEVGYADEFDDWRYW